MFRFLDRFRREIPNAITKQAMAEGEAYTAVCEGIDLINDHMPILLGRRLSLYVDRDYKPARIVLSDWSETNPRVVHGDEV